MEVLIPILIAGTVIAAIIAAYQYNELDLTGDRAVALVVFWPLVLLVFTLRGAFRLAGDVKRGS